MEKQFETLTRELMNRNHDLTYEEARSWIEGLWEDFETTRAKAGYGYEGKGKTEAMVIQWINSYGSKLHLYEGRFKHLTKK
ncbi:hypothetical protein A374_13305 [Fictibacillus macauensis ZFHKF-1]|uniref:WVELL protein n=1 Tax=Fictibacillus macauensis ZFHKF-1 TaxID=1196324 RepID=I8IYW5_9BACL|nr:YfhJ family protein [Fictibacillus macauensis]EIT84671.1 hypothetical protein A374_13305 [Fictibacillus macauensis ZFHKF-1]